MIFLKIREKKVGGFFFPDSVCTEAVRRRCVGIGGEEWDVDLS